jgi:RNA polymerase sigma-70 factor (ECF subfamily)
MSLKLNEKILLANLRRKDKDAFIYLYDSYLDRVYRFIYFKVGSKEEAEDLTSSVFLKIWNCVQEGNIQQQTIRPFIYTIARNLVIDHYRKSSQLMTTSLDSRTDEDHETSESEISFIKENPELMDEKNNLADSIDKNLEIETVKKNLLQIKDEYREIIILRYLDELSVKEISEIINKPKGNTRVLLHRALKALKEVMSTAK